MSTQRAEQRTPQRAAQRAPMKFQIRRASNRFDVDPRRIPPGMSYEWKTVTVMGQEDTESMITAEANYWVPVPAERHPEVMGAERSRAGGSIIRGGQMLMERPLEITEQSRTWEKIQAGEQYAGQLKKLKLDGHRAAGRGIKTTYESVPDDD